jgi:hypothetical protein
MLALIAWVWRNRYMLIAIGCAILIMTKDKTIADLRAKIADDALTAARAVNDANRQSFDDLVKQNDLAYAAIEAADVSAGERAAVVAKIKETARNAPIPPNACLNVGPRLGAVLDGLRHHQSAALHRDPRGKGEAAAPAADLRP